MAILLDGQNSNYLSKALGRNVIAVGAQNASARNLYAVVTQQDSRAACRDIAVIEVVLSSAATLAAANHCVVVGKFKFETLVKDIEGSFP